jgi:YD repeat-containing protein
VVEAKDGTQSRYGWNADSEHRAARYQYGGDGTQRAWRWSLDRVLDLHGNTMEITYTETSALPDPGSGDTTPYDQAAYPALIAYTANSGQGFSANREVRFTYSDRTDAVAKSGQYAQYYWTRKLDRVELWVGGSLARAYDLAYAYQTPSWHTEQSSGASAPYPQATGLPKLMLTSITEKDASGAALPATSFTYYESSVPVPGSSEVHKLQLKEVQNGYGGTLTYSYALHTPDGWWKLPRRYRVSQVQTDPGSGTPNAPNNSSPVITLAYTYGTAYTKADSYDYRGHAWVQVTDSAGHSSKTWFYTRDAINGKSADEAARLQSRAYATERWKSGAANYTTREERDWVYRAIGGTTAHFLFVEERRSFTRMADGSTLQGRKTRSAYDAYGNLVATKAYASATAGVDNWARCRASEYYPSITDTVYLVGKPAREVLYAPNGEALRDVRSCYDGSYRHDTPIGSGQYGDDGSRRARLTAVRRVLNAKQCVDVVFGYDGFGRQTSLTEYGGYGTTGGALANTDPRTTSVTYETTYQTYPLRVTNPLGQYEERTYDPKWGAPLTHTDLNGGVATFTYDTFGRLTKAEGPEVSGPTGTYRRTTEYTYFSPGVTNGRWTTKLKTRVRTDTGGATPSWRSAWSFSDGIGRV